LAFKTKKDKFLTFFAKIDECNPLKNAKIGQKIKFSQIDIDR